MRIPGAALRDTILIEPALGFTGDGYGYGPAESVRAATKARHTVAADSGGATVFLWSRARIRPDVLVTGAGGTKRPPAAGDRVTVNGSPQLLLSVEPVQGPGTAVAYLELIADKEPNT